MSVTSQNRRNRRRVVPLRARLCQTVILQNLQPPQKLPELRNKQQKQTNKQAGKQTNKQTN